MMNIKITIKNKGCSDISQLSEIKEAAITKWVKYQDQFKCVGDDFFTNDLSLAKRIRGSLNNYSKNFEAVIYIKLFVESEFKYISITLINLRKERRGKC